MRTASSTALQAPAAAGGPGYDRVAGSGSAAALPFLATGAALLASVLWPAAMPGSGDPRYRARRAARAPSAETESAARFCSQEP